MIICYTGPPGCGKTVSMVADTVLAYRRHPKAVFANMAGLKCPEAIYVEATDQFACLSSGQVLLDEAGIFFGSRSWAERSKRDIAAFAQVRKEGLDLSMTAQHENRLDTILRENASEFRRCRNFGNKFILVQRLDPHAEARHNRLGRYVRLMTPRLWQQYDTLARITLAGGTGGSGASNQVPAPLFARRRNDEDEQRRRNIAATEDRAVSVWAKTGNVRQYTEEAEEARKWLAELGWGTVSGVVSTLRVKQEVKRRRWLKYWGLTYKDVDIDCSFDNPWLRGYDPLTVTRANEEAKLQAAALEIIKGGRRRSA